MKISCIMAIPLHSILIRLLGASEQFANYREGTNFARMLDEQELNNFQLHGDFPPTP